MLKEISAYHAIAHHFKIQGEIETISPFRGGAKLARDILVHSSSTPKAWKNTDT